MVGVSNVTVSPIDLEDLPIHNSIIIRVPLSLAQLRPPTSYVVKAGVASQHGSQLCLGFVCNYSEGSFVKFRHTASFRHLTYTLYLEEYH
jgi:hypothetical protein